MSCDIVCKDMASLLNELFGVSLGCHDDESLLQIGFLDECLTVVLGGSSCLRASPRWIAAASERSPRLEFLV